jgi:hypothetical protein
VISLFRLFYLCTSTVHRLEISRFCTLEISRCCTVECESKADESRNKLMWFPEDLENTPNSLTAKHLVEASCSTTELT